MDLITIALATFTAIAFTLGVLPFRVPIRLMPVAVSGTAFGMNVADQHYPAYVMAAAVAGLVVIITRFAVKDSLPGPWFVEDFLGWLIEKTPKRKPRHRRGPWNGVLDAPPLPNGVGRRIPTL